MPEKELRNQIIRYVIYVVIVLGLTAFAFIQTIGKNASTVFGLIKNANAWWVLLILGVVILCILMRSTVYFCLTRIYEKKYPFHRAIAIDQNGVLYRMVTPAGLGSHFMQTYVYTKQKISLGTALSVIAMYSTVYQIALIAYNIITLILKHDLVNEIHHIAIWGVNVPLWVLVIIGFVFNLSVIGFIILISYWNGLFRFIRGPIVKLLNKVKLVKDVEKAQAYLDEQVVNFRTYLKELFHHWPTFLICVISIFLYITISYSVPYFAGQALGNESTYANFWDSVLLSNLHQMVACILPIPGGSLVSEFFFMRLFYPANGPQFFMNETVAEASLLLWRSLMFIIPLFISCLYVIIYRPRKIKNEDQKDQKVEE